MYAWLPFINIHFPGAGVTPFTVWGLTFDWWRVYRARANEIHEHQKAAARKTR